MPRTVRLTSGFTLIELIIVIILIGILSVTALPKLGLLKNDSQINEYRDRLLSLLRHQQLQAMQNTNNNCHRVLINSNRFGQQNNCTSNVLENTYSPDYLGLSASESNPDITFLANNLAINPVFDIRFNALGQPIEDCLGGCTIQIQSSYNLTITIESEGYIHR
ncbi:prepilin-type N-terminal cleavage/methylation domain-containing protein [Catenovulum sediminis]|uniref:Prepilin-type N-terminal cleavage/methylation domain-containing protein n=1 Tax=Catenovulum sediminis TaxID=1740262 RepID=A0ABV1RCK3_9ALTE|nr:prepilin-type N-terminal cleavage/methylation domain-containing protein [Catenovulum sediminis]